MKVKHYLLAFIIALSLQFTDFKISVIKLGDIFSLCLIGFYLPFFNKRMDVFKPYKWLFTLFSWYLVSSFLVLLWLKIYPPNNHLNLLRQPVFVSLSRYIQLIGCVFFALLIHRTLKTHSIEFNNRIFLIIDRITFSFFVLLLFFYALDFVGVKTPFVYGDHRLRGGFVEGGPFGLFVAFYFIYRTLLFGLNYVWLILVALLVLAAQSKASIAFILIALVLWQLYSKASVKTLLLYFIVLLFIMALVEKYMGFTDKIMSYLNDYNDIMQQLASRSNDPSLIMGRVAGAIIAPNMIKDNLLFGVGLGNYSLTRNNPVYLGYLPAVDEWDLTGLGGIVNLLIETGIVGVFFFFLILFRLYRTTNNATVRYLIVLFIMVQIFGVQTYFQYIWYAFGIVTAIIQNQQNNEPLPLTIKTITK